MKKAFFHPIHWMMLTFLLMISDIAKADFELGMKYYTQSNFEKAHREFKQAAMFGDVSAQFNLGVMYYRGEFVTRDAIQGYAWLALAAQVPEYKDQGLHLKIYNAFSDEQKKLADLAYHELFKQFNAAAIEERLNPIFLGAKTLSNQVHILKQPNATYPKSMLRAEKLGTVDLFMTIQKDGTTRDHIVYFSSDTAFSRSVLNAVRQWQYEPKIVDGKAVDVHGHKVRFNFVMSEAKYDQLQIGKILSTHKEKAVAGKPTDQFLYGFLLDILPTFTEFKPKAESDENANKWYLLAAQNGDPISSFFLGQNILNGNMCVPDPEKSMGWLLKAASKNMLDAQYLLAQELLSRTRLQKNEDQGMYWLNKAASGNVSSNFPAKLRLAWILATHPNKDQRDGTLALGHLTSIDKDYQDKQTYYRTAAAVYAENADFDAAEQWQEKALSDAKSLGLPLDALQAQLQAYRNKQPLREVL